MKSHIQNQGTYSQFVIFKEKEKKIQHAIITSLPTAYLVYILTTHC